MTVRRPIAALALAALPLLAGGARAQDARPWVTEIEPRQYVAVVVGDVDASAAWYAEALGLTELDRWTSDDGRARGVNLTSDRLFVELIGVPDAPEVDRGKGFFKVGFWVPDVAAVADRVAAATGERPRVVAVPAHGLRLVQIRDPDGNVLQLAEDLAPAGPVPGDLAVAPRLLALSVADLDASVDWHHDVLGFEEVERHAFPADRMRLAFVERDGFELELIEIEGTPAFDAPDPANPASRRGVVKVAFHTDAIDALYELAQERGARVQSPLGNSARMGGRFFILLDPDGTWVQVYGPAP